MTKWNRKNTIWCPLSMKTLQNKSQNFCLSSITIYFGIVTFKKTGHFSMMSIRHASSIVSSTSTRGNVKAVIYPYMLYPFIMWSYCVMICVCGVIVS